MEPKIWKVVGEIAKEQSKQRPMSGKEITELMYQSANALARISTTGIIELQSEDFVAKSMAADFGGADEGEEIDTVKEPPMGETAADDPMNSITRKGITCLECGEVFTILTNEHLARHDLDRAEYREKHGFPEDTQLTASIIPPGISDPKDSIQTNQIICLECGKAFAILTDNHLESHGLTKEEYRKKHGLRLNQHLAARMLPEEVQEPEDSIQEEKVICLECGKVFKMLTKAHLEKEHMLSREEYCEKHGLPPKQKLSSTKILSMRKKEMEERQKTKRSQITENDISCLECDEVFTILTNEHLALHDLDRAGYRKKHGFPEDLQLTAGMIPSGIKDPIDSIQTNQIVCLECGEAFSILTEIHLDVHDLTSDEYRRKYGFKPNQRLAARMLPGDVQEPKDSIQEDKVICLECGKSFQVLTKAHLENEHKLSKEEYCEKHGLPSKQKLSCGSILSKRKKDTPKGQE